jgi:CDP-glycerol glycerophosphotransferase (TagB/SpsB family)
VPGQVSKTTDELIAQMIEEQTCEEVKEQWEEKRRKFQEENYAFEDGNSTWRLMKLLKME